MGRVTAINGCAYMYAYVGYTQYVSCRVLDSILYDPLCRAGLCCKGLYYSLLWLQAASMQMEETDHWRDGLSVPGISCNKRDIDT
jgi:hypothetical protein